MLLEAGGDLSFSQLSHIMKREDGEFVALIISKDVAKDFPKWNAIWNFLKAIKFLDEQRAIRIIDILVNVGADLNFAFDEQSDLGHCWPIRVIDVAAQRGSLRMLELLLNKGASLSDDTFPCAVASGKEDLIHFLLQRGADVNSGYALRSRLPYRAIDVVAQRGSLEMVELLLNKGASLSDDTFPCAVASGNEDLIHFLLNRGADINSISSLEITALAAAIRLQNTRIINLLREGGAKWDDEKRFRAAIMAASEVGNVAFLKDLVQLKVGNPDDLGLALVTVTRGGFDEVAIMLIDAGANTNIEREDPPLRIALERRNVALVYALLDADADPNFDCTRSGGTPIQLAVRWGNRSVLEALLFAGAAVDGSDGFGNRALALSIAVEDRSYELVQLLLDAGADIYIRGQRCIGLTPLQAAAANGDIRMVHFLLDRGADPHDPEAFQEAFLKNREISGLLIDKHKAKYPMGRKSFGSTQLADAVEEGDENLVKSLLEIRGSGDEIVYRRWGEASSFGFSIFDFQGRRRRCRIHRVVLAERLLPK